jgi:heme/copper-type cytochrome/quinol oxidase subunit 4
MVIQISLISFSIIALVALFLSIKKYLNVNYKKVAIVEFFRILVTLILISFLMLNGEHKILNNSTKFIAFFTIAIAISIIFQVLKNKYKRTI